MPAKIIPDVVENQQLYQLTQFHTAREAAKLMSKAHVSAVLVIDEGRLIGIVTERDLTARILAQGADPDATTLSQIISSDPDTLAPDDAPIDALEMMRERGYRHLPVVSSCKTVGMVSIRDLYAQAKRQLEEDVRQREAFMFDTGYGAST